MLPRLLVSLSGSKFVRGPLSDSGHGFAHYGVSGLSDAARHVPLASNAHECAWPIPRWLVLRRFSYPFCNSAMILCFRRRPSRWWPRQAARHNLLLERGFRTYRAPRDQPEYFFFRLRLHFGPPLASGAGMRLAVSRRLAVLTLQDRWTRGCRRPCDGCIPFFLVRRLRSRNPSNR